YNNMKFTFSSIVVAALLFLTSVQGAALPPIDSQITEASAATLPRHALQKRTIAGLNDYSCKLTPAHPRPLLLVHATLLTQDSWWEFAPVLINNGYCVFALTYGKYNNIPLVGGIAPIEQSAQEVATFADNVLQRMNATQLDYVGHSQGVTSSAFMDKLNAGGDVSPGVIHSNIATKFDEVVTPYQSCFQQDPGVTNVVLQDLCMLSINEHLTMVNSMVVLRYVMNQLDPSTAKTANCLSALNLN
ncbi:hypothetical protein BGZ49_004175, partial [Haplosporangium sp. Z 27]